MHADEAAESVSCLPSAHPLGPVSVFPPSPPRLLASFTRSTRHYRTGCCTLPFAAAAISCRSRLSHSRPRRVSHSGAPTLDGRSIDLRDSIAETRSPESRPRSIGLSRSRWPSLRLSTVVARRKSAARSLNQRSYYAIVEELIKEIAWSYASHEWTSKVDLGWDI